MAVKYAKRTKGVPDPIDVHVGQRLRTRRSLLGMSQEKLAGIVNITFQQIQKYERGMNRISASRLYQFSKALDVPISYFYDQFGTAMGLPAATGFSDTEQEEFAAEDIMSSKETIALIKSYYAIKDPEKRKSIVRFIKSMADNEEN